MTTTDPIELQPPIRYEVPEKSRMEASASKVNDSVTFAHALTEETQQSNVQDEEKPKERWNESRANICRTFAAFWAFVVMGSM